MKLKVSLSFELEVKPEWYPTGVNTIEKICEYEKNNDSFPEVVITKLSEEDIPISIEPVR
jgi:hypothetical protein